MKQPRASIRYAKALLQLSVEANNMEASYKDMLLIDSVCASSKDFAQLLKSPIVKTDHKLNIIKEIFSENIGEVSMLFINIIVRKKRESLLHSIAKSFINLYKNHNNIETVVVKTATPISKELKETIFSYIKSANKTNIELKEVVDEKIIGGAIITMGDMQLDASIAYEIAELRQVFNKNLYLQDY